MIALVVLLPPTAAAAAIVYGLFRTRRSGWGRAVHAALPQRLTAGAAPEQGGRHRFEDAHTGSLSATAILQAMDAVGRER